MSYSITHYNGSAINNGLTIADGTIDTSLDIKLIGKSYAGYGQAQNENFVYLLENFANSIAPPNPLTGQIWYDSVNQKLNFFDGAEFRVVGSSTISSSDPIGLSEGDFYFDISTNQLKVWSLTGGSGSTPGFVLIGPQTPSGSSITEMRTTTVKDTVNDTHTVIEAYTNGEIVFIISADATFDLPLNAVTGFTTIHQGITLVNTGGTSDAYPGVTSDNNRFWGTASNADKLGGVAASNYVLGSNASFGQIVHFSDSGFTVGNTYTLDVSVGLFNGVTSSILQNIVPSSPIVFQTTNSSSATLTPLQLLNGDVLPGGDLSNNLGSGTLRWNDIYGNYLHGTSLQADNINVNGSYYAASTQNTTGTFSLVARDTTGTINVTYMNGTASQADSLKFGSSYITASSSSTANTIVVRDPVSDIYCNVLHGTATQANLLQVGSNYYAADTANTAYNIVARDVNGNFSAGTITATLSGNTAGVHTGNVNAVDNSTAYDATSKTFTGSFTGTASSATNAVNLQIDGSSYAGASTASSASNIVARDINKDIFCNVLHGTATTADYADLAEKYLADAKYDEGTVVAVGGEKEVTASSFGDLAIGVVSLHPAYKMNNTLVGGTYIALKGRVPVKVVGAVKKGDRLVASDNGCAQKAQNSLDIFAVALETNDDTGVKLVECVVL